MGLLDFLGTGMDDPRTMASLALAQGLLSAPKNSMQGLSSGLLGYQQMLEVDKRRRLEEESRRAAIAETLAQAEQRKAMLAEAQAERTEKARRQEAEQQFAAQLVSPQMQAAQAALRAGGGPTVGNAAAMSQVNESQQMLFNAMRAGLVKPLDYFKTTVPKPPEYKVVGNNLVKIGDGKVSEAYKGEDTNPSDVKEYLFAQRQGYPGSYNEFRLEGKKAGATSITNSPQFKTEVKTGESLAGQVGPIVTGTKAAAVNGLKLIDSAGRILDAAEKGNIYAGPLASVRLRTAQFADIFGLAGKDTKETISNTRATVRALAEQAVAARSQLGGQAQISNTEQALITKATSAEIDDVTADEVVQLAELNDRLGRQMYAAHEQSMEGLKNANLPQLTPFFSVPPLPAQRKSNRVPSVGETRGGYRFKGGNPADPASWEKL